MIVANAVILLANLAVLGLTLKLYTEYFKDCAQNRRAALPQERNTTDDDPDGRTDPRQRARRDP